MDLIHEARRVATDVAGPAAATVDRDGRLPYEALAALRDAKLLSASVPRMFGGGGATLAEIAIMTELLAHRCAATGMLFAMHHIQVASLIPAAKASAYFAQYLGKVVSEQRLIASVTSEAGTFGDMRSSIAAVEPDGQKLRVEKHATTISYGEAATDLLLTARRSKTSPASDQLLVLLTNEDFSLERTTEWDTLGMRGTQSPGFIVRATFREDQVVPGRFADVASEIMIPYSHVVWASLWLGIANDAVAKARSYVRAEARRSPGSSPRGAIRLAEVVASLELMRDTVHAAAERSSTLLLSGTHETREVLSSVGFNIWINSVKINASKLVTDIVGRALEICGIAGYKNDSPYSLGRNLRDAYSAAVMIQNDRLLGTNGSWLLVHKDNAP